MLCLVCGQISPGHPEKCPHCGTPAPSTPSPPPILRGRLNDLQVAAASLQEGSLSPEDFIALLDRTMARMEETLQWVKSQKLPEDFAAEIDEEIKQGCSGIEMYLDGLNDLRTYVSSRLNTHLEAGLAKAEEGNRRLNCALALNWETFRNYQQITEEIISGPQPDEMIISP